MTATSQSRVDDSMAVMDVKNLGIVSKFLGICFDMIEEGMSLNQELLIDEVLKKFMYGYLTLWHWKLWIEPMLFLLFALSGISIFPYRGFYRLFLLLWLQCCNRNFLSWEGATRLIHEEAKCQTTKSIQSNK